MLKKLSVILTALCLSACSQNVELSKPAPQKMKVQTVDKNLKRVRQRFICVKAIKQ